MPEHEILPECKLIFERLELKIDGLTNRADKINGRYEKHLDTSDNYRLLVTQHEIQLKDICSLKQWWQGALLTLFLALISMAVMWGMIQNQVNVNTTRLERIERLHLQDEKNKLSQMQ